MKTKTEKKQDAFYGYVRFARKFVEKSKTQPESCSLAPSFKKFQQTQKLHQKGRNSNFGVQSTIRWRHISHRSRPNPPYLRDGTSQLSFDCTICFVRSTYCEVKRNLEFFCYHKIFFLCNCKLRLSCCIEVVLNPSNFIYIVEIFLKTNDQFKFS